MKNIVPLFATALFSACMLGFPISVTAQQQAYGQVTGSVSVRGFASVELSPDEVLIQVSITDENKEAMTAMLNVQEKMAGVVALLKANKDVEALNTEYVNLSKRSGYNRREEDHYWARQSLSFVLTDLKDYDDLLDQLLQAGVNELGRMQFRSSKAALEKEKLMARALNNAKAKAQSMAAQYGQKIGRALRISDMPFNEGGGPSPMYKNFAEAEAMPSIVGGNLSLSVQVYVEFELK